MIYKIVRLFHENIGRSHPVWFLRGNHEISLNIAREMMRHKDISESRIFHFNDDIDEFWKFIEHHPTNYRACVCVLKTMTKISSLLKIIEEPPSKTYFILIGTSLPATHMNRIGFIHDVHADDAADVSVDDMDALANIEEGREIGMILGLIQSLLTKARQNPCEMYYQTLLNLISVYDYVNSGRISPVDGVKMCTGLINVALL